MSGFGEWLAYSIREYEQSENGKKDLDGSTLQMPQSQNKYLRNRLHSAFMAGAEAARQYHEMDETPTNAR